MFKNIKLSIGTSLLLLTILLVSSFMFTTKTTAQEPDLNPQDLSLEKLDSGEINLNKDSITNLGMFFQNLKEDVSLGLTFDKTKKNQKRLEFAQKRLRLAHNMAQKEDVPERKLIKLNNRAHNLLDKTEQDSQELLEKMPDSQSKLELAQDMMTSKANQEKVATQLLQVLPIEETNKLKVSEEGEINEAELLEKLKSENEFSPEEFGELNQKHRQVQELQQKRRRINQETQNEFQEYKKRSKAQRAQLKAERKQRAQQLKKRMRHMRKGPAENGKQRYTPEEDRRPMDEDEEGQDYESETTTQERQKGQDKGNKLGRTNMFFQNMKEKVSLGLTFDKGNKAEKSLEFAQQRLDMAQELVNSQDMEDKKQALDMSKRADELVSNLQENHKEIWQELDKEEQTEIMEKLEIHQNLREQVMEDLSRGDLKKGFQEELMRQQQKWQNRQNQFRQGMLNNEHVPEQVKTRLKARQKNKFEGMGPPERMERRKGKERKNIMHPSEQDMRPEHEEESENEDYESETTTKPRQEPENLNRAESEDEYKSSEGPQESQKYIPEEDREPAGGETEEVNLEPSQDERPMDNNKPVEPEEETGQNRPGNQGDNNTPLKAELE